MNLIVVGCGRVGAELCYHLFKRGHQVVVVDIDKQAFNRLHPDFRGRTLEGEGLAEGVLERAGIRDADGLAKALECLLESPARRKAHHQLVGGQHDLARIDLRAHEVAREREERRRWMASWEPILRKVYGPVPDSAPRADPLADLPPDFETRLKSLGY